MDAPETTNQIRSVLIPFDNTRLDGIVDIMFATTSDAAGAVESNPVEEVATSAAENERSVVADPEAIARKRSQLLKALSEKVGVSLIKNTRATYWDPSHDIRAVCAVSKAYPDYGEYRYWYAYHPKWDQFLTGGKIGLVAWSCLDLDIAFVMPRAKLAPLLSNMNVTKLEGGKDYWHIKIKKKDDGSYFLHQPLGDKDVSLSPFQIALPH